MAPESHSFSAALGLAGHASDVLKPAAWVTDTERQMEREKRAHPRIKRRVNCSVSVKGNSHVGVVMDLSRGGFFVQTGAMAPVGSRVDVALLERSGSTVEVNATVTNRRQIPRPLTSVAKGGLGCRVNGAPEDYYRLLAHITTS